MIRHAGPIVTVAAIVIAIWYIAAIFVNAGAAAPAHAGLFALAQASWSEAHPLLPAPHQILYTLGGSVFGWPVTSPRNLLYHAAITGGAALAGLGLALSLGILLAIGIVHARVLDRSLMPWIIASQTVPVLAIAPMVVVVLGDLGLTGLLPKAAIAGYLAFLPITIGMVKGLRAPEPIALDLMRTYSATPCQSFRHLRWPASLSFLLPSLRIAVALAVVGAIVAELPTGAVAGLGARLLAGSYYGQTLMMWATLLMAALVSMTGLGVISLLEAALRASRGGRL